MKAAIYCRLSEEDRNKLHINDDSCSIQNQKTMLLQYAKAQGWEIFDIYSDDDYTGADRRRPQFNRLLEDAKAHKFDIVLCKTQSRFTRELELVETYIHGLFPIWGIRFVSIVDNADTDNKGNKKARQINGLVNEWYLEDMSENIRSVLTSRRQNGFHIGSFAPYGYRKDPRQKGHLLIDPEAAKIVKEVFTLFSQGYGKTAIARILNDRGVPNPTEYKRLHGLRYQNPTIHNSTLWKYYTISHMLTNEVYIGTMVQGKYGSISYKTKKNKPRSKEKWIAVKGTHAPIIDPVLWNRVQMLISERARPFQTGKIGLFSGKVRCADCGYTLRSSKSRGRYYLQCQSRYVSKNACLGAFIPVRELEAIVLRELNRLSERYLDRKKLECSINCNSDLNANRKDILDKITEYDRRVQEYAKAVKELYMDKVRGILTEEDFLRLSTEFSTEQQKIELLLKEEKQLLQEIDLRMVSKTDSQGVVEQYLPLQHLQREMIDAFVDYIKVGHRNRKSACIPVEIYWNF